MPFTVLFIFHGTQRNRIEIQFHVPIRWKRNVLEMKRKRRCVQMCAMDESLDSSCAKWINSRKMDISFEICIEFCVGKCWPDFYISIYLKSRRTHLLPFCNLFHRTTVAAPAIGKALIYFHNGAQIAASCAANTFNSSSAWCEIRTDAHGQSMREIKLRALLDARVECISCLPHSGFPLCMHPHPPEPLSFTVRSITETAFEYQSRCSKH